MHPEPASGTLSFLFTDVEGSAGLWDRFPREMKPALERHDAILRAAIEKSSGQVVKTTGDGFMAVFASAVDAVSSSLEAQRELAAAPWSETGAQRVRMGLHSGEADVRGGDYFGPTVNALVVDRLPDGTTMRDLGEHRLKDLGRRSACSS